MKIFMLILITLLFSLPASSNGTDWVRRERKEKLEKPEHKVQKMEAPYTTPIGGAESGELEKEEENGMDQQEKMQEEARKQKFLYEHEGKYRRGL